MTESLKMFEVGKKYKYRESDGGKIYECVFTDSEGALLRYPISNGTNNFFVIATRFFAYKEYKEPQTIRGFVRVYKDHTGLKFGGIVWRDEKEAKNNSDTHIDVIEVTYTEKN